MSKSEFARRIGKDEKEARRLLDPAHPSKLSSVTEALRELGQKADHERRGWLRNRTAMLVTP
jgi:hypothetical protein